MTILQTMHTEILAAAESAKARKGYNDDELAGAIGVTTAFYRKNKSNKTLYALPFSAIYLIAKLSNSELILRSKVESFT